MFWRAAYILDLRLFACVVTQGHRMPKRTRKQREQVGTMNKAKAHRALGYAWRLSPYVAAWQAEGLTQRELAGALNTAGAPVPSEYTGDKGVPTFTKRWTLGQVQRLLRQIDDVKQRMAWWAKRSGKASVPVYGDGAGLFAYPQKAPAVGPLSVQPYNSFPEDQPTFYGVRAPALPARIKDKHGREAREWVRNYVENSPEHLRSMKIAHDASHDLGAFAAKPPVHVLPSGAILPRCFASRWEEQEAGEEYLAEWLAALPVAEREELATLQAARDAVVHERSAWSRNWDAEHAPESARILAAVDAQRLAEATDPARIAADNKRDAERRQRMKKVLAAARAVTGASKT